MCVGENALELSGAICCAGRLMRLLRQNGYFIGGCYSCVTPSRQYESVREHLKHLCECCDLVITIGCEGFRDVDVMPGITNSVSDSDASFFALRLCSEKSAKSGLSGTPIDLGIPSRATAAFCSGALIMNLPSDPDDAEKRLESLIPSVGFALNCASGKSPSDALRLEKLLLNYYSDKLS